MRTINEELERVSFMESLQDEGFDQNMIESIVDAIENPQDPAYVCNTLEELRKALNEMCSKED